MGRVRQVMGSLSLCVVVAVALGKSALATVTPLEQAQFVNWTGRQHQAVVTDGSVLTEYQGVAEASNRPGMLLKVSFSPRFSCTPMIGLLVPGGNVELGSAKPASGTGSADTEVSELPSKVAIDTGEFPELRDDEMLDFRIDGVPVEFPLIVDADKETSWNFNGDKSARETLRLQIDIGDIATVAIAEGRKISFSLLGSRKTLKALQTLCRQHQPIPFDD